MGILDGCWFLRCHCYDISTIFYVINRHLHGFFVRSTEIVYDKTALNSWIFNKQHLIDAVSLRIRQFRFIRDVIFQVILINPELAENTKEKKKYI